MGLNKLKTPEIFRKNYTLDSAGLTKVEVPSDVMPSGLIKGFWVRLNCSALSSFDSAVANYPAVVRAITYGSQFPKHNVMSAVPLEYWDKVYTNLMRKAPSRTTPSANGFALNFYLPYAWPGTDRSPAFRDKDTALLNINNKALPFITLLLGPYSDVAITLDAAPTVTVIVEADYEPIVKPGFMNPDNPLLSGDQPLKMLEIAVQQKADLSTVCEHKLLSGGDRECIGVIARQLSSAGAEVSNIFTTGVATPSKMVFIKGDADAYNADGKVETRDSIMSDELGIAVQAGYHYWLAARRGKLMDAVDLREGQPFRAQMDNLATTASRVLEFMQIGTIDIPKSVLDVHAAQLK